MLLTALFIITSFVYVAGVFSLRRRFEVMLLFPFAFHYLINVVGVLKVGLWGGDTLVGISVSHEMARQVAYEFFISNLITVSVAVCYVRFSCSIRVLPAIKAYYSGGRAKSDALWLVSAAGFFLLIDSLIYGTPPGLRYLTQGAADAALHKGAILESKMSSGVPVLGYLVRYLPVVAFVHVGFGYIFCPRRYRGAFTLVIAIFAIYSFLSLVKSYLLFPASFFLFAYVVMSGRGVLRLLPWLFAIVSMTLLSFAALPGSADGVLITLVRRVFLAQSDGMFLIRDMFSGPSLDALFLSSPLRHFLDLNVFDPAAVLVESYFGVGEGWVNMNSYFSGQAWVMFGAWYMLLVPLSWFVQILLIKFVLRGLKTRDLAVVILVSLNIFLPLSNNIANLVWFKDLVAAVIIVCAVIIARFLHALMRFSRRAPLGSTLVATRAAESSSTA